MPTGSNNTNAAQGLVARDKYRLVPRDKTPLVEGEVRVSSVGALYTYEGYAAQLLTTRKDITVRATGNAIGMAIALVERLRETTADLHQVSRIAMVSVEEHFEPLEDGLDPVDRTRTVPSLEVFLTTDEARVEASKNEPGYQPPKTDIIERSVRPQQPRYSTFRRGGGVGGGFRGGRGGYRGRGGGRGGARFPGRNDVRGGYRRRGAPRGGERRDTAEEATTQQ